MKIKSLSIENVLGCRNLSVTLPTTGSLLIAGPNASAKSSVAEAIRLAILGGSDRARAKKLWSELVHDGSRSGRIQVVTDSDTIKLQLPAGKATGRPQPHPAEEVCLGQRHIGSMTDSTRLELLRETLGGDDHSEAITAKLIERGHPEGYLRRITPLLKAGAAAAASEAQGIAREHKALWRDVTGEQWGADKAEHWTPDGAPAEADPAKLMQAREANAKRLKDLASQIGEMQRRLDLATGPDESRIQEWRDKACQYAEAEDHRLALDRQHQEMIDGTLALRQELNAARAGASQACPCCEKPLKVVDGKIVEAESSAVEHRDLETIKAELESADRVAAELKKEVDAAADVVAACDAAARKLRALDETSHEDVDQLTEQLRDAEHKRDCLQADQNDFDNSLEWIEKRNKAADIHDVICKWLAIADDLKPGGITDELAGSALDLLAPELDRICAAVSFDSVQIDAQGALTYAGRDWWYCSESERWRAEAACLMAIAKLSGFGTVILDRMDVLAPAHRPGLLLGLDEVGLDTAIVCCTLANRPNLPAQIGLVWTGAEEEQAVAA